MSPLNLSDDLSGRLKYDQSDHEILLGRRWYLTSDGYAGAFYYELRDPSLPMGHGNRKHKTIKMHRLLMQPKAGEEVDHINGDPCDNRRENLRVVTRSQNCMNTSRRSDNLTGIKGVHFDKSRSKWMAYIKRDKIRYQLGRFSTLHEATIARKAAEMVAHGEYSRK